MPTFGKKKNYTDWLYTTPTVIVLGGLVLLLGVAVLERYGVERDMYARRIAAETERQKVLERQAALEAEVEYLEGERGIEEEIRKHFDVAKEGETVIILMGEDAVPTPTEAVIPVDTPKWYQFWR